MRLGRRHLFLAVIAVGFAAAFSYEFFRDRPAVASPVASRRAAHSNETARLEGGFAWSTTRAGEMLFDLSAATLLGLEGGLHFLEDVEELKVYLQDGRAVLVSADRGRLERKGSARRDGSVVVVLFGNVRVKDPDGVELFTEELSYDADSGLFESPGEARVAGDDLEARFSSLRYRPEGRIVEAEGTMEIKIGAAPTWLIEAPRLSYRLATGDLVFPKVMRARREGQTLLAGATTVRFPQDGEELRFVSKGPVLLRGSDENSSWQVAAAELRVTGMIEGSEGSELVELGQPATLVLKQDTPEGTQTMHVRVANWRASKVGPERWALRADGGFEIDWWQESGGVRSEGQIEGNTLEILRDSSGELRSFEGLGEIVIRGPGNTVARGDAVTWNDEDAARIVLAGAPARAWQDDDLVAAPRLVLQRADGILIGEGGAHTEIVSMARDERSLFPGTEPVRVTSDRVFLDRTRKEILFEGRAQAWQGTTLLRAAHMRLFQEEQRLLAEGSVNVRLVVGEGSGEERMVRVLGDRFEYNARSRIAEITGNARFNRPGTRIRADRMEIEREEGERGLRRLDAYGRVVIVLEDESTNATGTGDRLSWLGGRTGTVVLLGEDKPASFKTAGGDDMPPAIVEAPAIRYDLQTKTVITEAGEGRSFFQQQPGGENSRPKNEDENR